LHTFNGVPYDPLGEVRGGAPGVPPVGAGDAAETRHVLPRHQLVGLGHVAQDRDEEEEERARELVVHRAWVHGAVPGQEGGSQHTHVLPLETPSQDGWDWKGDEEHKTDVGSIIEVKRK